MGVLKLESLVGTLSNRLSKGISLDSVVRQVGELLNVSSAEISGNVESLNLVIARCLVIEGYMSHGENPTYETIALALQRPLDVVQRLHQELREAIGMPDYQQKSFPTVASLLKQCQKGTPPEVIITNVAKAYGVNPDDVRNGKNRRRHISLVRHLVMYILRENFSLPYRGIGAYFDKGPAMSHTSVRLAVEKISGFLGKRGLDVDITVIDNELFSSQAVRRNLEKRYPDVTKYDGSDQLVRDYITWRLNAHVCTLVEEGVLEVSDIVPAMSRLTGLDAKYIMSERRSPYAAVRAACCVVAREVFNSTYKVCGGMFGGRDHSTIIYYLENLHNTGLVPEGIAKPRTVRAG